jgi:hypothetical protein
VSAEEFAGRAQAGVEAGSFSAAPEDQGAEEAAPTVTTISASAQAAAVEPPAAVEAPAATEPAQE